MRNLKSTITLIVCYGLILSSTGAVTFDPAVHYSVCDGPIEICAADFDEDGDVDLTICSPDPARLSILNNAGDATFPIAYPFDLMNLCEPSPMCAADFDQDGDTDLITAYEACSRATCWINDPLAIDFHFLWAADYRVGLPNLITGICAGDVDGDGYPDLVATAWDGTGAADSVFVLLNCLGSFVYPVTYPIGTHATAVCVQDLDGDGHSDLAATDDGGFVYILVNNGDGTFQPALNYAVGIGANGICAGDFDGDGDVDLATANQTALNISILVNNGDATFANAVNYSVGQPAWSVCSADLDGEGTLDLAVVVPFGNGVMIFSNDGSGNFSSEGIFELGSAPYYACAADFDGDNDIDLAAPLYGADSVAILLNTTVVTGVNEDQDAIDLPASFQLRQNYPNPFNPSTTIGFDLPYRTHVDMTIYNISGQAVRHLVNEELAAGTHLIEWDSKNDLGEPVATGIYLCHFKAGDITAMRKMALLK